MKTYDDELLTRILAEEIEKPSAYSTATQFIPPENLTLEKINEACIKLLENTRDNHRSAFESSLKFGMGITLIESPYAVTRGQFRFPKTKKKRILKKWSKRDSNFRDVPCIYAFADNFVAHHAINLEKFFAKAINVKETSI